MCEEEDPPIDIGVEEIEIAGKQKNLKMNVMESENEVPRRYRLDLCEPAELAIYIAIDKVEKMPADTRLTEAVILLGKARELVADFIDNK